MSCLHAPPLQQAAPAGDQLRQQQLDRALQQHGQRRCRLWMRSLRRSVGCKPLSAVALLAQWGRVLQAAMGSAGQPLLPHMRRRHQKQGHQQRRQQQQQQQQQQQRGHQDWHLKHRLHEQLRRLWILGCMTGCGSALKKPR